MQTSEKAHPIAATTERASAGAGTGQTTTSVNEFTTITPSRQVVHIADLLSRGAENGVTLRHLENMTGQDGRTIRLRIELERRQGVPILADCKSGYFLPSSESEKARCVRSMRGRATEILKTATAIGKGETD